MKNDVMLTLHHYRMYNYIPFQPAYLENLEVEENLLENLVRPNPQSR